MKRFLIALLLLLLLVACGGNTATEPAANTGNTSAENAAGTTGDEGDGNSAVQAETTAEEAAADETEGAEAVEAKTAEDEALAGEPATTEEEIAVEEEAMDTPADGLQMSGTDPASGLEINPDPIPRGVEFIAIGDVIQMNLTPQSSPEFVIRGPNGVSYRIATQALSDIHTLDGNTLLPHEYKINMIAQATVFLAADAALTDVLTSDNFTIVALP